MKMGGHFTMTNLTKMNHLAATASWSLLLIWPYYAAHLFLALTTRLCGAWIYYLSGAEVDQHIYTKVWLRTFCVTNQVKRRIHRCKKCTLHVTFHGKQWKFSFERLLIFWLTKVWLRTFCVTNQVKRRIHRNKKCTLHVTCHGKQWKFAFERLLIFWLTKV